MTVLKLSKSGKQLQIIDDQGNVFGLSVLAARMLLDGKVNSGFTKAMRLPFSVSPDRFGPSELWDPEGKASSIELPSSINTSNDALSYKSLKKVEINKNFEDKTVW